MKQRSAVAERAGQATLQEPPLAAGDAVTESVYAHKYLTRLEDAGLFPGRPSNTKMTVEEVVEIINKLLLVDGDVCCYRIAIFDHLAEQGLLPKPGELTGEELEKFIFMKPEEEQQWRARLSKRKSTPTQGTLTGSDSGKATETTPDQHRARVRIRKSYVNPAREDTVMVGVHVAPELKDALKKKFEQSRFEHFNDFLAAGLQSMVQEPPQELKPTAELVATALTQTRNLEKTINLLSQNVSTRLSHDSTRSR